MPDFNDDDNQKIESFKEEFANEAKDLGYSVRSGVANPTGRQKRTHLLISINGIEKTAQEWAAVWDVCVQTIHNRVARRFELDRLTAGRFGNVHNRLPPGYPKAQRIRKPYVPTVPTSPPEPFRPTLPAYHQNLNKLFAARAVR